MANPSPYLVTSYERDLRLFPTLASKIGLGLLVLVWLALPFNLTDYQLLVLVFAGIAAIGGIGLNLLTGYTGQVSLGHAFFLGVGAYTAAYLGARHDLPLVVWLPAAALLAGLVGAVIGPFALRLRGQYLGIVTLGLVFVGLHVFENWNSVTGGNTGTTSAAPVDVGVADFSALELGGQAFTKEQSWFWFVWALVGLVALLAKNIVRSRPGRAMQAVRDRDLAAEVVGVSLARTKVGAFAVSSALAGMAGALFASFQEAVNPENFTLLVSIQYIAVVIVGGVGTVFGSILGALLVGPVQRIVETVSRSQDLPFVSGDAGGAEGVIAVASLNRMIFGALIIVFLIFEPRGLAAIWLRAKAYFKTWPFSY
ncbi:MAG TPA: branched-chain amino acid ABC transporter permease [Acidimicrobiales bacterium]|jgi:branched-chain amino acid transport system permease protein